MCSIEKEREEHPIMTKPRLCPEHVTDSEGRRKAVILPVDQYEELLEDLDDLAVMAERRDSSAISHSQAKAERSL